MSSTAAILAIERLTVDLPAWAERPHAVEDVSLELSHDEILCVVGESGSGKSLMARAIVRQGVVTAQVLLSTPCVAETKVWKLCACASVAKDSKTMADRMDRRKILDLNMKFSF